MAIVELQFKKQGFLDFFKAEINRRRLPFSTLNFFAFPQLQGKLLEQIECTNCTEDVISGEGQGASAGAVIGIRHHGGRTQIGEIGDDGVLRSGYKNRNARKPAVDRLARNLGAAGRP